jgi:hypothetical protein
MGFSGGRIGITILPYYQTAGGQDLAYTDGGDGLLARPDLAEPRCAVGLAPEPPSKRDLWH